MFDRGQTDATADDEKRWREIEDIYSEAEACQKYHKDESAWTEVVRLVLKAAGIGARTDMLEINNV